MRIVKEHDERKNEIIDTAAMLFESKGYEQCSVNDILTAIGIAKGTFYHYFKSKEEVLDAVIAKMMDQITQQVRSVEADPGLSPEEKLLQVFLAARTKEKLGDVLLEAMHKTENALMHQKAFRQGYLPVRIRSNMCRFSWHLPVLCWMKESFR